VATTSRIACFAFALGVAAAAVLFGTATASADPIPDPNLCDPAGLYCAHIPLVPAVPAPFVNPDGYWVDATNPHPPVVIPDLPPPIQTEWTATAPPPPSDPFCDFGTHLNIFGTCATGDTPH